MKKFAFRLERLRELRERAERARAAQLGAALRAEQVRADELQHAQGEFDRAGEQTVRAGQVGPLAAGLLRVFGLARVAASRRVHQAEESLEGARAEVESAQQDYGDARRDLRIVEKLKEKRLGTWREEVSRDEQKESDGIARDRRNTGERS